MSDERSLLEQALACADERQITLPVFSDVALKVQKASVGHRLLASWHLPEGAGGRRGAA